MDLIAGVVAGMHPRSSGPRTSKKRPRIAPTCFGKSFGVPDMNELTFLVSKALFELDLNPAAFNKLPAKRQVHFYNQIRYSVKSVLLRSALPRHAPTEEVVKRIDKRVADILFEDVTNQDNEK